MVLLETATALADPPGTWQGSADMDSLYVLLASLLLAFVAFVILMRARF